MAAFLGLLIYHKHRLTTSSIFLAMLASVAWTLFDRVLIPYDKIDLPLGNQTSGMCLLVLAIALLVLRMFQGRRGFERIFILACMTTVLLTNLLFHFVLFEVLGRQWIHDSMKISQVPLAVPMERLPAKCKEVLLYCSIKPLVGQEEPDTGTLIVLRTRGRVILEGARSLYPLTESFHQGRNNYLAAYHVKDGQLVELTSMLNEGPITRVIGISLNALSFSVGFVWIAGALYLTTFHRRRINDRRRLSALRG
jgi:hypothetical protein